MMIKVVGSGSKGNAYIIDTPEGIVIVELGMPYKTIMKAINFDLKKVLFCLVSHSHADHSRSINDFTKMGIDVYSHAETFAKLGVESHRAKPIEDRKQFSVGGFSVIAWPTKHDDVFPLGFLIYHPAIGKVLFATDTYYIDYLFPEIGVLMIECNYSKDILNRAVAGHGISPSVANRLLYSHFSLERVLQYIKSMDRTVLRKIYLMHLSNNNSDADLFQSTVQGAFGIPVEIC